MQFDWDPVKARSNLAKHGVSFETASGVFNDPFAYELLDDRENYGEDRFVIVGMMQELLLSVVYTERDGIFRLISARLATRNERNEYVRQDT